jgi:hypothetical protein
MERKSRIEGGERGGAIFFLRELVVGFFLYIIYL